MSEYIKDLEKRVIKLNKAFNKVSEQLNDIYKIWNEKEVAIDEIYKSDKDVSKMKTKAIGEVFPIINILEGIEKESENILNTNKVKIRATCKRILWLLTQEK